MATLKAKRFEFAATVDSAGHAVAEGEHALELTREWTPEHLVLAALVRCSIKSLRYHARRAGIVAHAAGSARGVVTKRESDGRYAFVEIDCRIEVELDPVPAAGELQELLEKAERDCFVGASLTVRTSYDWRVGGSD